MPPPPPPPPPLPKKPAPPPPPPKKAPPPPPPAGPKKPPPRPPAPRGRAPPPPPPQRNAAPQKNKNGCVRTTLPFARRAFLIDKDLTEILKEKGAVNKAAGKILVHGTKAVLGNGNLSPAQYAAKLEKIGKGISCLERDAKRVGDAGTLARVADTKKKLRSLGVVVAKKSPTGQGSGSKTPGGSSPARRVIKLKVLKNKDVKESVFKGWSGSSYYDIQKARQNPSASSIPTLSTFRSNFALQTAFAKTKYRAPATPPFVSSISNGRPLNVLYRVQTVSKDSFENYKDKGFFAAKGYSSFSRRDATKPAPWKAHDQQTRANMRFGCPGTMLAPVSEPNMQRRADRSVILILRLYVSQIAKGTGWLFFSRGETNGGRLYDDTYRAKEAEEEEVLLPPGRFTVRGFRELDDTKFPGVRGNGSNHVRATTIMVDVSFTPFHRKPLVGFAEYDVHDLFGKGLRKDAVVAGLMKKTLPELKTAAALLGHTKYSHLTKPQLVELVRSSKKRGPNRMAIDENGSAAARRNSPAKRSATPAYDVFAINNNNNANDNNDSRKSKAKGAKAKAKSESAKSRDKALANMMGGLKLKR